MQTSEPTRDVQALLQQHIESYEQLELLLLLRAERNQALTQATLCERVGVSESLAVEALEGLQSAGFVQPRPHGADKRYAYVPQTDEVEATISRLALAYREQPIQIIRLMSANAIERVRTAALRRFADAFILRKDRNRG